MSGKLDHTCAKSATFKTSSCLRLYTFRNAFFKVLQKQGIKFKLGTKVVSCKKDSSGIVKVNVDAANGGKEETVNLIDLSCLKVSNEKH